VTRSRSHEPRAALALYASFVLCSHADVEITTMTTPRGFFRLQTPLDLLEKMEYHLKQLRTDPLNEYAAFDFFVAAAHLPEWLGKFKCAPGKGDARAEAMKRVAKHLANGAKHFEPDPDVHSSVQGTAVSTPAISGLARSGITFSGAIRQKSMILLTAPEATALGVKGISAVALAEMIVDYWKRHPSIARARKVDTLRPC
jgi:hypothetical protein